MTWEALGAIGEIAGALAVVASLVYVGRQVQLNAQSVRAASQESAVNAVRDVSLVMVSDADLGRLFTKGLEDPAALTEEDRIRFFYFTYNILKAYEGIHFQYETGNLDEEAWAGFRSVIASHANTPGVQAYWAARRSMFSSSFGRLIESLQGETALPQLSEVASAIASDDNEAADGAARRT